jgi:CRP-like cAMP-binding protein
MTAHMPELDERYNSVVADTLAPYETIEAWPVGKVLFREGVEPSGVYFLHSGDIDLSFSSKPLLAAHAGEILGLTSVMSSRPHDSTAVTRTACITGFVEKNQFLRLLDEKPQLWLTVLRLISTNINQCWDCMRSLSAAR